MLTAGTRRVYHLFKSFGASDYIGEPVSIVQHSLQAAYLASLKSPDKAVVVASLLHDIGYEIVPLNTTKH